MGEITKINNYTEFYYHFFRNILLVSMPLLAITALILSSLRSSAFNYANDNLSLSIPISCSLSATVSPGEEHTISMVAGTYEDEIGKTTINNTCNDPNGYVVYAIGNARNNEGSNVISPNNISDTYSIPTGTNTSGDTSQWAMKLTAINSGAYTPTIDNGYTSYSLVPNSWVKVAHKDPGTTDVTKNSAFTTTYAIYLEGSQPAGTYNGQVKYVMLHPSTAPHPTDTIEHAFALAGKTKLILKTDGTVVPETSPEAEDMPEGDIVGRYYRMQDMETSFCENTSKVDERNTTQLIDIRDNKTYWVTKLQDGHCWMTQNLALDIGVKDTTLGIDTTVLTSEDTDLNVADSTNGAPYYNGYSTENNIISWMPANITKNYSTGTGTDWADSNYAAYSLSPGEWYWDGNDSGTTACNYLTTTCEHFSQTKTSTNERFSVGNYYNWSAAVASDNTSVLDTSTYNNPQNNPQNSICPKGWRLPTISSRGNIENSTNEFARINNLYPRGGGDIGLINSPLYFVRSGYVISATSLGNAGGLGYYWSSTVGRPPYFAYYLKFQKGTVSPNTDADTGMRARGGGFSVRCLAR